MRSYPSVTSLCAHIESAIRTGTLAQANLFVSPLQAHLQQLIQHTAAVFLCEQGESACQQCQSCTLFTQGQHPDYLCPAWNASDDSRLKMADIRALQEKIYIPPQIAKRRVLVLPEVDHFSRSVANALLKILEEPPAHLYFILTAQQVDTVLPTILSRCQLWRLDMIRSAGHYFQLAEELEREENKFFAHKTHCMQDMVDILHEKSHPCDIALQWGQYPFSSVMLFLYLVTAMAIQIALQEPSPALEEPECLRLVAQLGLPRLYQQIDAITANIKLEKSAVAINKTLVLESLLMAYQGKSG
ncbi:MAG: hypothetical protein JJT82_07910 [Legionellaceae bacterium]|nr:hypothetical protein [Legionellaceae bacterium]